MVLLLPFKHAAEAYKLNYLQRWLQPSTIGHTYTSMFAGFLEPDSFFRPWMLLLTLAAIASVLPFAWRCMRRSQDVPAGLRAGLFTLLCLPIAN